ncbi:MAG: hypothetical protein ABJA66_19125 [Actinomycetota bacterium]
MISQKCPKCLSSRIRRGYRPTPLWSKLLFRYNLLCDNCNWEFIGFAVPGTVSSKPTRSPKKQVTFKKDEILSDKSLDENNDSLPNQSPENVISLENLAKKQTKAVKKVKVRQKK